MKKLFSILLTLVLALSAMSFAAAEAADIAGTWYLNQAEAEGIALDPAMLGLDMTLILNADGSCVLSMMGDSEQTSWAVSGSQITIGSGAETITALLEGENLVIVQDEVKLIFGKEKTQTETYVPGAVRTDATAEDFKGTWSVWMCDMMGMQVPVASLGMGMTIIIDGDTVTIIENEGDETDTEYGTVIYENGKAIVDANTDDEIALHMLEDGSLAIIEEEDGMTVSLYFEKIA